MIQTLIRSLRKPYIIYMGSLTNSRLYMGISSAILSGNAVFASSSTDCSTLGFAIRFCAVVNAGCISAQKPSLLQCRPFQRSPEYYSDVYSPRPPDIRVRLLPTKPPVHFTTEQPGRDSLLPIFILQRPILSLPRLFCLLEAVKLQYNEQPPCRYQRLNRTPSRGQ